ncbi:MAG: hypothetical protein SPK61_04305 [Bacteroidales bacterium]|nr:hypothetical protein [Bacteroidales bacterium]MDY6427217.1 hypothetical protein [Bacteroidales bacterium]
MGKFSAFNQNCDTSSNGANYWIDRALKRKQMETEQVIVSLYQGGMHLTIETSRKVLEKMSEIKARDPQKWQRKDMTLMKQAKQELGIL